MAVIEVRGLRKTYRDGTQAVRGVDFSVEAGTVFGLLGPNGAGKTTTMRILGTLHPATAGSARVLGLDVLREGAKVRRRIGFAMQDVGMDDLATAREMLQLHARLFGIKKAEARRRASDLLETFRIAEHADRRVTRLSGGLKRRLDLAVSLIHRPEVLFLDEPSTGLDPSSRGDLWNVLRTLRRETGITVLMSTHYMEEADALCDEVAIMDAGTIAAIDTPERLKRSLGSDQIHVRFAQEPSARQRQGLERTLRAQVRGDQMVVRVARGEAALAPVVQVAARAKLAVAAVKVVAPTLDDVFRHYTGGTLDAEASGGGAQQGSTEEGAGTARDGGPAQPGHASGASSPQPPSRSVPSRGAPPSSPRSRGPPPRSPPSRSPPRRSGKSPGRRPGPGGRAR